MGDKNAIELIGFPVPFHLRLPANHLILSSKKFTTTTQKVTARRKMDSKNAIAKLELIGFSVLVQFRFSKKATKT